MAMPTREIAVTTIEELLALPEDGLRHELLDGVHVVTPAPEYPHQAVLGEFYFALGTALQGQDELQLLTSPADIVLSPRTLVQPDVFVIRKQPGQILKRWSESACPCSRSSSSRRAPPPAIAAPSARSARAPASPSTGSWTWTRGSSNGG